MSGCVVTATLPPPRGILVSGPPPALIPEERPAAPAGAGGGAWVAGYWHWTGLQYAWIPGHWEAAPPLGATWQAPLYVQNSGAYFYEPGGWATIPMRPKSAPLTRAPASVEAFH